MTHRQAPGPPLGGTGRPVNTLASTNQPCQPQPATRCHWKGLGPRHCDKEQPSSPVQARVPARATSDGSDGCGSLLVTSAGCGSATPPKTHTGRPAAPTEACLSAGVGSSHPTPAWPSSRRGAAAQPPSGRPLQTCGNTDIRYVNNCCFCDCRPCFMHVCRSGQSAQLLTTPDQPAACEAAQGQHVAARTGVKANHTLLAAVRSCEMMQDAGCQHATGVGGGGHEACAFRR